MHTTLRAILCSTLLLSACDRDRRKTPEEMLDADIALAADLARANDVLGEGEPDTLIGLIDDEPPPRVVAPPPSAPGCTSPATADQRDCLLSLLARYDVELNRAYRGLIQRMRSDAGTGAGEPDPASVDQLRAM